MQGLQSRHSHDAGVIFVVGAITDSTLPLQYRNLWRTTVKAQPVHHQIKKDK